MIPDALKPAICPLCGGGEETTFCSMCGGSGINPDMIRTPVEVDDDYAMSSWGIVVAQTGRYVVIPLEDTQ